MTGSTSSSAAAAAAAPKKEAKANLQQNMTSASIGYDFVVVVSDISLETKEAKSVAASLPPAISINWERGSKR